MAYTSIDDPSAHFQTALWTGTGSAGNAVTFDGNSDMQPDWVWSKRRDVGYSHVLKDTSRGGTSNNDLHLVSDLTNAESTYSNYRMDFNSDGFTADGVGDSGFQGSGSSMVSWCWKANGGTTSSNTDGYLTSTVQANTTAGFSIVTFTADGNTRTVGHGLGVKPDVIWIASRNVAGGFLVITDAVDGSMDYGTLRNTNAFASISYNAPTSTVFEYNDNNTNTQVAYCFAQKQGYSKFGKYVGNGSTDGVFVYTGFKPAFLLYKKTGSGDGWFLIDSKRDPDNGSTERYLRADESGTEATTSKIVDFCSNGFKLRNNDGAHNGSGNTYIYMAFAENPFVTSTGIPTTAR